ncbi:MAG: type II toxin-antitoxin system VapC family toxin [Chloroflexota bacterium]
MNAVVLDASVQMGWLVPDEPWHAAALAIASEIATGNLDAAAAPNLRFEVCNALVKAARRGRLGWDEVDRLLLELDELALEVAPAPHPRDVLAVCREYRLGWGDAHHALLARRLGRPLLTADRRLVDALRGSDIWVEWILDWPPDRSDTG